eukprot:m51a1_g11297 hypothetical protein (346) ;mRNA; f:62105-63312
MQSQTAQQHAVFAILKRAGADAPPLAPTQSKRARTASDSPPASLEGAAPEQARLYGLYLLRPEATADDRASGARWLAAAAARGDAHAQLALGLCYAAGDASCARDMSRAAFLFELAASHSDAAHGDAVHMQAVNNLAFCYASGEGVERDASRAAALWSDAARAGDAMAQMNLGACYANGDGVRADAAEAARLWSLAASAGSADAQYELGLARREGSGVARSDSEAARLFALAAEQGHAAAMWRLAQCVRAGGDGVDGDPERAQRLLEAAARGGSAGAMVEIARGLAGRPDARAAVRVARQALQAAREASDSAAEAEACDLIATFCVRDTDAVDAAQGQQQQQQQH